MHNAATLPVPWLGRYPERADDQHASRDRQFWRTLATPFWTQRRALRRSQQFVAQVEALSGALAAASDESLAGEVLGLRRQFSMQGLTDALCARSFAVISEAAQRSLGQRPYPCQVQGGWAILHGMLAEMATGEGKTLAVALAAATAALAHMRTHVITINDYLAERDARELAPLYGALGLRVAGITPLIRAHAARVAAWRADVVYCSNKTLAFDYLRDRVSMGQRRGPLHREIDRLTGAADPLLAGLEFGIVDEADSVLIDECRTPLILSRECAPMYPPEIFRTALDLARQLAPGEHFTCQDAERRVVLTAAGRVAIDVRAASLGEFWLAMRRREELVRQALVALHLLRRDEHYLVRDDGIQIVDANTGRVLPDRSWELGLHQLVEAKESRVISGGRETIARITYQRLFGRYHRLGATTGTAREVAAELWRVYGLRMLEVPRHRPNANTADGVFVHATLRQQREHIIARCRDMYWAKRPVLLATRTVVASEELSRELAAAAVPHAVLNARNDQAEAAVIAMAGQAGHVTVATNMAGRGTDIKLGGGVGVLGGLHVIATEFNESRRFDRQLIGRAGRQGDPGSHVFVLSLEDALIRLHAPAWLRAALAGRVAGKSAVGNLLVSGLLRWLRWKLQASAAQQRRRALVEDRRIGDALSFTGMME